MYTLVTNNNNISNSNYEVQTFDEFMEAAQEEGISIDEGLYFDVNCIDSEDTYELLIETGVDIEWISFEDTTPDWFSGVLTPLPDDINPDSLDEESMSELAGAMSLLDMDPQVGATEDGNKIGRIITFGSAKGGSGKTFTSLITAIYYAKDHPNQKVCILDLDIEEPQIAIVIRALQPTVKGFYPHYYNGDTSFDKLEKCKCNNQNFPPNLDFYLSPRDLHPIQDEDFWQCIMVNLFMNYDMVFLDTGTTYMETPAIASAYKVADKITIVSMANLASTVAVGNQIKRLTGEVENDVYSPEDGIENKLNLVITNAYDDRICRSIIDKLGEECTIIAKFGNLTQKINEIQMLSKWDMFDNNIPFRETIRNIYS